MFIRDIVKLKSAPTDVKLSCMFMHSNILNQTLRTT